MKRKALIIGNSGNPKEYLDGVKKDVKNYKSFLQSNIGGAWYEHEIVQSLDETKEEVVAKIRSIKSEQNDFIFILFSGHGSYSSWKECRKLYIYDDFIYEEDLLYAANKQITIMDTCAGIEEDMLHMAMESAIMDSIRKSRIDYRKVYEDEIKKCSDQQVILYSCSIDESSQDDSELGGYFAHSLLNVSEYSSNDVLNSREAYLAAKGRVQAKTNGQQNPQCKCVKSSNVLPFSIKE